MKNKILRKVLYVGSVSIFGILAIVMFILANNVKNKYSSDPEVVAINKELTKIENEYNEHPEEYQQEGGAAYEKYQAFLADLNEYAKVYDGQYKVCSITGYVSSILTLVAFGVVLHISDKLRTKEDNSVEILVAPNGTKAEENSVKEGE